jgi:uracil-DNA glycosylase family 4
VTNRDARRELAGLVAETHALLDRERARGRERIVLTQAGGRDVPPGRVEVRRSRADCLSPGGSIASPGPGTTEASPPPLPTEQAALPGFEALVPAPPPVIPPASPGVPGLPLTQPLAPRPDLPGHLTKLAGLVSGCRKCPLCETRTQTVFSDGPPDARLLFVGEAPGADEDAQGVPFVGRAGQLLNKMIAAIDLKREEVYICNVLKCRPPGNRTPQPAETAQCLPYLEQQIALVRPALICAMGLPAVGALLKLKGPMGAIHGKTFQYRGVPVIPTYHPAALLRTPSFKRDAWEDLKRVRDTLKGLTA